MSFGTTQRHQDGPAGPPDDHAEYRFLDAASGIPMTAAASAALTTALRTTWQDPRRRYPAARRSRQVLEAAGRSVALGLGAPEAQAYFLSSETEALRWVLSWFNDGSVITSAVEAVDVLREIDETQRMGRPVQVVPVDAAGHVDPVAIAEHAGNGRNVVVVQDVNLEMGARQPMAAVRAACGDSVPLVVDARANAGRDTVTAAWDVLLAAPYLWGGPPGVTIVLVRHPGQYGLPRGPVLTAGTAPGCEMSPSAPAVAAVAALALEQVEDPRQARLRLGDLSEWLRESVLTAIPDSRVVGQPDSCFITMFTFLYVAADELIDLLAQRGWACASGASCTADTHRPHHVLAALGASTHGSLRVSLPPWVRREDLAIFVADLAEIVETMRQEAGVADL